MRSPPNPPPSLQVVDAIQQGFRQTQEQIKELRTDNKKEFDDVKAQLGEVKTHLGEVDERVKPIEVGCSFCRRGSRGCEACGAWRRAPARSRLALWHRAGQIWGRT